MPRNSSTANTQVGTAVESRTPKLDSDLLRADERREIMPDRIMQLGLGFWGSKTLLSAVELGVFTELAKGPLDGESLRGRLGLHRRSARDFFDALVALGMLQRSHGRYRNTPEGEVFLDRAKPSYVGGLLEMANARLFRHWANLTAGLKSGEPQNEVSHGKEPFVELYADPSRLKQFLSAMTGVSMGAARALAQLFPWESFQSFLDVGGAQGCVSVQLALAHSHLVGGEFDLPMVGPIFEEYVQSFGLAERLHFSPGAFLRTLCRRRT